MQFFKFNFLCFVVFCFHLSEAIVNGNIPEGTLKLIIKTYIEDLIASTDVIDDIIKTKLLLLSDHVVSHPALYQTHFHVGTEPPKYEPQFGPQSASNDDNESKNVMMKRQTRPFVEPNVEQPGDGHEKGLIEISPPDEICKTNRLWEPVAKAHDYYDNEVDIIQTNDLKQFIFTYRCVNKKPCQGISPFFKSECTERKGFVTLYHQPKEGSPKWGPVKVPHHCACKIQRLFGPTESSKKKRLMN